MPNDLTYLAALGATVPLACGVLVLGAWIILVDIYIAKRFG